MSHPAQIKQNAISLRKKGFSIIQIARQLGCAKSTISLWVSNIPLPKNIADQLKNRELKGRLKGLAVLKAKRQIAQLQYEKEAHSILKILQPFKKKHLLRLLCAVLFWCEGSKRNVSEVRFTNSDPHLVQLFLHTFRSSFPLDESKFKPMIHLHEYHDEKMQGDFWSRITGIPTAQFTKPYRKPHTGFRKRDNYPGCLSLRYGDAKIAKRIDALYHALARQVS